MESNFGTGILEGKIVDGIQNFTCFLITDSRKKATWAKDKTGKNTPKWTKNL